MGFLDSVTITIGSVATVSSLGIGENSSIGGFWGETINNSEIKQPKNFDKYNEEIEKNKQYIKAII